MTKSDKTFFCIWKLKPQDNCSRKFDIIFKYLNNKTPNNGFLVQCVLKFFFSNGIQPIGAI